MERGKKRLEEGSVRPEGERGVSRERVGRRGVSGGEEGEGVRSSTLLGRRKEGRKIDYGLEGDKEI